MFGPDGMISARRLRVLIEELPLESNTKRALGAPKPGDPTAVELWSLDLLAVTAEALFGANFLTMKIHSKRGTHIPDPVKIPRHWRDTGQDGPKPQSSPAELASFFGKNFRIRYTPKET